MFAARTAGADDGTDVAALTPDRVDRLKAVFWDMCAITSEVETIPHPDSDPDDDTDDSWTERILHITITAKTAEDMRTEYAFTEYQNQALTELLAELSTMELLLTDLSASQEQARNILRNSILTAQQLPGLRRNRAIWFSTRRTPTLASWAAGTRAAIS